MRNWTMRVGGCAALLGALSLSACGGTAATDEMAERLGTLGAALTSGPNGLSADLVFDAEWGMGYCVRVLLSNQHPTATTGTWTVGINLGASVTFTTYDGVFSANTGAITVTPKTYNAAIAPSGSAQFGFCASIPNAGLRPVITSVASDLPPVAGAVVVSEYKLPATLDPVVNPNFQTELWASLYRPAVLESGRRYPLVVFLHGNHPTCGRGTLPRFDDNSQYSETGSCPTTPPGYVVVPNHRGFDYLGQDLAARGYIAVSINANRGVNGVPSPEPTVDELGIRPRARLVLRHLERLSRWDAGVEATPTSLGINLRGRIDFSEVGLLGHSRGGEGVRLAYGEYVQSGSPWPARILSPVSFRGIFEIGPTDASVGGAAVNAMGLPWNVLLPACDWDLRELPGVRPFDRMLGLALGNVETTPLFKSFYHVWGTNHNYYNSEWHFADAGGGGTITGCINHEPLFDPAEFGSAEQRETGRFAAAAFFTANVGSEREAANNAVFDPAFPLPVTYRVNRGYHPGGRVAFGDANDASASTLVLEDFLSPTGTSSYGLPNTTGGTLTVTHSELIDPHDSSLKVATIDNVVAGGSTFLQSNWANAGTGFDLTGYDFLDLRVDRTTTDVPNTAATFLVQLVNANNTRSAAISIDEFIELLPPPRSGSGRTLQTLRIPLGEFQGAQLSSVRGVRFTFSTPFQAGILLANIRATHATTALPPPAALGAAAQRAAPPPVLAPSVAADAALAPERVTQGNTIQNVASRGSDVAITLTTSRFFDERARNLVLSIGAERSQRARHPNGDLYSVEFLLSRTAFDRLRAREPISVSYGSSSAIVWEFGNFDKAQLGR